MDYSGALWVQKPWGNRNAFRERVEQDEILDISLACRGGEGHSKQKGQQQPANARRWARAVLVQGKKIQLVRTAQMENPVLCCSVSSRLPCESSIASSRAPDIPSDGC
jgi:hypothetical protein